MLKHCHDRYKAQEVCDKAVASYLLPLKLVLVWFVTNKINEQLGNSVFSNDYIAFADLDGRIGACQKMKKEKLVVCFSIV